MNSWMQRARAEGQGSSVDCEKCVTGDLQMQLRLEKGSELKDSDVTAAGMHVVHNFCMHSLPFDVVQPALKSNSNIKTSRSTLSCREALDLNFCIQNT